MYYSGFACYVITLFCNGIVFTISSFLTNRVTQTESSHTPDSEVLRLNVVFRFLQNGV